jgi:hypothetical protein
MEAKPTKSIFHPFPLGILALVAGAAAAAYSPGEKFLDNALAYSLFLFIYSIAVCAVAEVYRDRKAESK